MLGNIVVIISFQGVGVMRNKHETPWMDEDEFNELLDGLYKEDYVKRHTKKEGLDDGRS